MFQTVCWRNIEIFRKRWYNYKNNARKFFREESCTQQHLLEHFQSPGHTGFIEGFCLTFIDEANPFIPTMSKDY